MTPATTVSIFWFFYTNILFSIICYWIIITFSVPFTMKYPFGSYGHYFNLQSYYSLSPFKWQRALPSMIGILPILTFFLSSTGPPNENLMSTLNNARNTKYCQSKINSLSWLPEDIDFYPKYFHRPECVWVFIFWLSHTPSKIYHQTQQSISYSVSMSLFH